MMKRLFGFGLILALLGALILVSRDLYPDDPPSPSPSSRAYRAVRFWIDGSEVIRETKKSIPGNMLSEAGIRIYPGDQVLVDGLEVPIDRPLEDWEGVLTLQILRAIPITVRDGEITTTISTTGPTLGAALEEAGIVLQPLDQVTPELQTTLVGPLEVSIQRATPISIQLGTLFLETATTENTVAAALDSAGVPLQGMDFTRPSETDPIPADGQIEVIRVREEIIIEEEILPFETLFQPVSEIEIDTQQVIQAGELGIAATRTRIRYENEVEIQRITQEAALVVPPKPRIIGYGTQIILRTLDTPDGPFEYWRAVDAWATSYSPCRLGADFCGDTTALGLPLEKGVAGVSRAWYNAMAGQRVYVPDYGPAILADTGAVPGYWIDLGYSDDDWVSWAQNVVIYFLTPIPALDQILWILPE